MLDKVYFMSFYISFENNYTFCWF